MIILQESLRAVFYAPFYAALARDAFATEGVEINFVSSPTPDRALDGLMDGTVDVCWGGPMRVNLGYAELPGADFVCFGEVVTRDPFFLVTRIAPQPYRPELLVGLRLGSVTEVPTPWLCLQHDVRLAVADPGAIQRRTGQSMAENAAALLDGTIEVAQLFQPYVEQLLEDGCHIWHAQADRGPCSYTTFYARRATLEAKRPELQSMVRAVYKTQQWLATTTGAVLAETVAGYFPDIPRSRLIAALDRYHRLGVWGRNPVLPRTGYDRLRDSLVTGGLVSKGVSFEQAVDNTLAEAAMSL